MQQGFEFHALFGRVNGQLQHSQRLEDVDADGACGDVHPLHVQPLAGVERGLHAVADEDERGVGDVQIGIHAERSAEHQPGPGLVARISISIEEIPVIEVAIRAGEGDRVRRLMDRIVVSKGQGHGVRLLHKAV